MEKKNCEFCGSTENTGPENDGPSKYCRVKIQDLKLKNKIATHENAGHENTRYEITGHEKAGKCWMQSIQLAVDQVLLCSSLVLSNCSDDWAFYTEKCTWALAPSMYISKQANIGAGATDLARHAPPNF